ncbi:hypothetical protein [Rhodococcus sp. NPDC003348]
MRAGTTEPRATSAARIEVAVAATAVGTPNGRDRFVRAANALGGAALVMSAAPPGT